MSENIDHREKETSQSTWAIIYGKRPTSEEGIQSIKDSGLRVEPVLQSSHSGLQYYIKKNFVCVRVFRPGKETVYVVILFLGPVTYITPASLFDRDCPPGLNASFRADLEAGRRDQELGEYVKWVLELMSEYQEDLMNLPPDETESPLSTPSS